MAWNPSKTVLDSLTWNFKKGEVTGSLIKQIENKNNIRKIRGLNEVEVILRPFSGWQMTPLNSE